MTVMEEARKPYWKVYDEKHPDRRKASAAKYRKANLEKCRERVRPDRVKHKEKRRENRLRAEAENPERIIAYQRKYKNKNREILRARAKKYREQHPHVAAASHNKRKATKLSRGGTHTAKDISEIFYLQRGKCAYCRSSLKKYHVDHIIPFALDGRNDRSNLQLLCPPCNLAKSSKHPIKFAQERGLLL